ncbi:uncharacterized protein N7483_011019 [Penicillium malachiteum]|uniref:uncharacterized protein n=1 Tax=Penicillium malachiteum TaxID=1324776 RepID=UPI002549400F|nr:uncharacterized protein N7483_011019 [Penicillium malachiteum]KAJ5713838.1 hypothetical protein N7483_011019 [Penicillium malachiteum]
MTLPRFASEEEKKDHGFGFVMLDWVLLKSLTNPDISTVVAAAVRLAYVVHLYKNRDLSWDVVPIYVCSVVEISTALVASSIPTLRLAYLKCFGSESHRKKKSRTSQS